MKSKVLVVGSVAYDVLFSVHNTLKDEIVVDKNSTDIKDVSMMLTAANKKVYFGGTGGNIAFGLGIQKVSPYLFSVAGDDFHNDYESHLSDQGINLRIIVKEGEYTATFYGISDAVKDQVGIFQPNTHGDYMDDLKLSDKFTQAEIDEIKVAIFSPGTGNSITSHMKQLREEFNSNATIIFDPSQILSIFFTEELLKEAISYSNIFIGNETETEQLQRILSLDIAGVLNLGLDYIIETKGKHGSIIHSKSADQEVIPAEQVENFVEQTGAGDAFRAGFIKGILDGNSITDSCKLGSKIAALNIASEGAQKYKII